MATDKPKGRTEEVKDDTKTDPDIPDKEGEDTTEEPEKASESAEKALEDDFYDRGDAHSRPKSRKEVEVPYDKDLEAEHRKLQSRGWKRWGVGGLLILGLLALVAYIAYSAAKTDKKKPTATDEPVAGNTKSAMGTLAPGAMTPAPSAMAPAPRKTTPAPGAMAPAPRKTKPTPSTKPPAGMSPGTRVTVVRRASFTWDDFPVRKKNCASDKHADFTLLIHDKGSGNYYDGCYLKPRRLVKKPLAGAHVPFHRAFNIHDPRNRLDVSGVTESMLPLASGRFVNNKHLNVWRIPRRILRLYMKEYCGGNVTVATNDKPVRRRATYRRYRRTKRSGGSGCGNLCRKVRNNTSAIARNKALIDGVKNTQDRVVLPAIKGYGRTIAALRKQSNKIAKRLQRLNK